MSKDIKTLQDDVNWHLNRMEDQWSNDDALGVAYLADEVCNLVRELARAYLQEIKEGDKP